MNPRLNSDTHRALKEAVRGVQEQARSSSTRALVVNGKVVLDEGVDFESFRAHWKKAPSSYDFKMSTIEGQRAYYRAYFKHFEDRYGEIPEKVKKAIYGAGFKSTPSITHNGEKFIIRTGMDEMELLYHVFNSAKGNQVRNKR